MHAYKYKGFLKISPNLHLMKTPKLFSFPDKSSSIFLDISDYFLATPLKMLKLSFYCFPEKGFIDPRDHINICKDFGKLKWFRSKKIWTPDLRTCYMEVISVIQQLGN